MYVHIGEDVVLRVDTIVAILDARLVRASETNQQFLQQAASQGRLRGYGLAGARSMVVTTRGVYPSPVSPSTLARRARIAVKAAAF